MEHIRKNGSITRMEAACICNSSADHATFLLRSLVKAGKIAKRGNGRSTSLISFRDSRSNLAVISQ